jgi:hypothetical protein
MSETILPTPLVKLPPTQAELPDDDGVPLESARHKIQIDLLIDALIPELLSESTAAVDKTQKKLIYRNQM